MDNKSNLPARKGRKRYKKIITFFVSIIIIFICSIGVGLHYFTFGYNYYQDSNCIGTTSSKQDFTNEILLEKCSQLEEERLHNSNL